MGLDESCERAVTDQLLELQRGVPREFALWAHNSHLGDTRATGMGELGEWNVGQLARERFSNDTFLHGFTTYSGR